MWVLVPLTGAPAAAAASGGEAAAQQPQPQHSNDRTHFLTCAGRDISVGRPLKKGSSVGKADILVFNEQSVSTVHAHLKADLPGSTGDVPTHGALTITDCSKFGTHLRRLAADGRDSKLSNGESADLHAGDVLRLGTHCRFIVSHLRLLLCATAASTGLSSQQLQAQAAALNAQLTPSVSAAAAAAGEGAADAGTAAYCITQDGQVLTPAVLAALVLASAQQQQQQQQQGQGQWHVVTPAWLQAVAARRAWTGTLPSAGEYAPRQLLLPALPGGAALAAVDASSWAAPGARLLAGYYLVLAEGCEADMGAAAAACGATCSRLDGPAMPPALVRQQAEAAAAARVAVLVRACDWAAAAKAAAGGEAGGAPEQQEQVSALPCISELQLLHAIVLGSADCLAAAMQQHADAAMHAPGLHTAAASAGAGGDDEADETEDEEQMPHEPAADPAQQHGCQQQHPPVSSLPASLADAGWMQHSHGRTRGTQQQAQDAAATQTGLAGRKRGAAASTGDEGAVDSTQGAGGAAGTPASKRRKTAAAAGGSECSPGKVPLALQPAPPPPPPQDACERAGAGAGADGALADGAQRWQSVTAQLCMTEQELQQQQQQGGSQQPPQPQQGQRGQHAAAAAALGLQQRRQPGADTNFKAFRRKGSAAPHSGGGGVPSHAVVPVIQLVAVDLNLITPDDEARNRQLRAHEERKRVAAALWGAVQPARGAVPRRGRPPRGR